MIVYGVHSGYENDGLFLVGLFSDNIKALEKVYNIIRENKDIVNSMVQYYEKDYNIEEWEKYQDDFLYAEIGDGIKTIWRNKVGEKIVIIEHEIL